MIKIETVRIKKILIVFFIFLSVVPIFAQKVSKKQDIAVFKLSHSSWTIPQMILDNIDRRIVDCFSDLKRFNIIAMSHRISSDDLDSFNRKILESREKNAVIPEKVLMGQESFTYEDWKKTVNSYFLVVPIVTDWVMEIKTVKNEEVRFISKEYNAKVSIDFHIYSIEQNGKETAFFTLDGKSVSLKKTVYFDEYWQEKKQTATISGEDIKMMLERNLRAVEAFTIKSGVIKTEKKNIFFELGNDIGIKKGDEYVVIGYDKANREIETGFAVVTNTEEDSSIALTLYSKKEINLGDQIKEIPRLPVEFRIYFAPELFFKTVYNETKMPVSSFGIHISHTRGFYRFRPCYGVELNLIPQINISKGLPFTMLLGMEIWNSYFGRLQVLPTVQGYFTGLAGEEKKMSSVEAGARIFVHTAWLITRDIKLGLDLGFKLGMNLSDVINESVVFRGLIGLGLTIKF